MGHKYKSLLQNIPARHIIAPISANIREQLERLREVDVNNFFVLGRLSSIKDVLEVANNADFFTRKFAWHALTQVRGHQSIPNRTFSRENNFTGQRAPALPVQRRDYSVFEAGA
jgi:hypothetical protein